MSDNKKLTQSEYAKMSGEISHLKRLAREKLYYENPKLCLQCNGPIDYKSQVNKFCGSSCGANFSNAIRSEKCKANRPLCLNCNNKVKIKGQTICSSVCFFELQFKEKCNLLIDGNPDTSTQNLFGKKFLIKLHEGKCQICSRSEWIGKPMPLVLDHIDGNSDNNLLSNLRVICNNCDAQLPTFCGKNKKAGKNRQHRLERYYKEKEILKIK